jgi:hypothetical protein
VVAFDVSATSVRRAAERWADLGPAVRWEVADLCGGLPPSWSGAFDLVVEAYTVQVLPPGSPERAGAPAAGARCVAPGGAAVVVARGRADDEPEGLMPWPLRRDELDAFADGTGLVTASVLEVVDRSEDPPVRRWVARFDRPS